MPMACPVNVGMRSTLSMTTKGGRWRGKRRKGQDKVEFIIEERSCYMRGFDLWLFPFRVLTTLLSFELSSLTASYSPDLFGLLSPLPWVARKAARRHIVRCGGRIECLITNTAAVHGTKSVDQVAEFITTGSSIRNCE